eukprot:CAMPEP_0114533056 /NCGR_PEP_ID=MMETSP0109-20121206/27023_1 /TAXON_ID=29199 /ORGANISM="Chlorarachnion reptans, Strain CCCM449" /LENGTH=74 /DNA_ID=CAMNT_0001716217 /DNA_START=365 /DNA_END=589 /DNA_ORIENTATION=+
MKVDPGHVNRGHREQEIRPPEPGAQRVRKTFIAATGARVALPDDKIDSIGLAASHPLGNQGSLSIGRIVGHQLG